MASIDDLIQNIASKHGLDALLIRAIVEQESGGDTWAIRYEPAFQRHYVDPLKLNPTEATARSISWGLMQLMGQVARELGFAGPLASLCNPAIGLDYGCRHFRNKLARAGGDVTKALLLWNGGGNPDYPKQVLNRVRPVDTLKKAS